MNLQDKTILIVGGALGIGQATARLCAERGATVIVADFNTTDGNATAKEVNGTFIQVDVTDEASVQAMCAQIEQTHGKLDVLIQTAGILKGAYVALEDFELATLRQVIDVNTIGSFLCAKYTKPLLLRGQLPVIILISSPAAYGVSSSYAYAMSKGGVSALGTTMAGKLAPEGIRVNVVFPGSVNTFMKRSVIEADAMRKGNDPQAALAKEEQAGSLIDPAGVGKVLAFLASDDAEYVRGAVSTR